MADLNAIWSEDAPYTAAERAALTVLVMERDNNSGRCSVGYTKLANRSGISMRQLKRILPKLESEGIIARAPIPRDGKANYLYSLHIRAGQPVPWCHQSGGDEMAPDPGDGAEVVPPRHYPGDRMTPPSDMVTPPRGHGVTTPSVTAVTAVQTAKRTAVTDRVQNAVENSSGFYHRVAEQPSRRQQAATDNGASGGTGDGEPFDVSGLVRDIGTPRKADDVIRAEWIEAHPDGVREITAAVDAGMAELGNVAPTIRQRTIDARVLERARRWEANDGGTP